MQLGIGLLQEGGPELVGAPAWALVWPQFQVQAPNEGLPRVHEDEFAVVGGESVVHEDFHPVPVLPELPSPHTMRNLDTSRRAYTLNRNMPA